jgi:hypothetical protein
MNLYDVAMLPGLPPAQYLATFISNLRHYATSEIEGEPAQTRVTSRIRAEQAARLLATYDREVTALRSRVSSLERELGAVRSERETADG